MSGGSLIIERVAGDDVHHVDATGEWDLLGQRAIDATLATLSLRANPAASVGRLWPEHFDYGLDLTPVSDTLQVETRPAARCNLGAAATAFFTIGLEYLRLVRPE